MLTGCQSAQVNFFGTTTISNVSSNRLYETGQIEFDLTHRGDGNQVRAIEVEVTIWTFFSASGTPIHSWANVAIPYRSRHEMIFERLLRKRRVVLKVQEPGDPDTIRPTVEVEVRLVFVGYQRDD